MSKFTKYQQVMAFYNKGRSCVETASFLFDQKKQNYDLLLLQGIELLLKSFILMKDRNITESDLRNKYSHKYYEAFIHCLELDDSHVLSDPMLKSEIECLHYLYESNYTELRYPGETKMRRFPITIFKTIDESLIKPMFPMVGRYYHLAKHDEGLVGDTF